MLTFLLSNLLVLSLAEPGDIYRCVGSDGVIQFSDEPCGGPESDVLKLSTDASENGDIRLWKWLDTLKPKASGSNQIQSGNAAAVTPGKVDRGRSIRKPQQTAVRVSAVGPMPARPFGQQAARVCSTRFFECAQDDGPLMDRCVNTIAECASGVSSGCCPVEYLIRYRSLRAVGNTTRTSVRGALLGVANE